MPRLFIAVRPPAEVLDALAALPRPDEPGVRWVRPEHWHITVRFLGEADLDETTAALEQWESDESDESDESGESPGAAVEAAIGPRVSRLGRNVVCLPVAGLEQIAASVGEATASIGDPVDPRPFTGHLTLARLQHRAACGLAGTVFAARFPVTEVELVRSTLGRGGAVHDVVSHHRLP